LLVPLGDGADGAVAIGHGPISDVDRRSVEVLCRTAAAAIRSLSLVAAATLNDKLALIGRMSASVAHEMNNPLAYVTLNLNLLDEQTTGPGQELVRATLNGVNRLARIVSDLSRAARGEADAPGVEDLGALVADEVRVARARSGSTVELSMAPTAALWVRCERGRVAQAVLNLLVNALDAAATTPGGGRVEVSVRCDGARGVVTIRDNGPGVPPAVRRRLFDAFFTTKGQHGTGLGLYLSRQFVERQGGALELVATDATGTTFELSLPTAAAPAEVPPRSRPLRTRPAPTRPRQARRRSWSRQSRSRPRPGVACWSSTTSRRSSASSSARWAATPTSRRPATSPMAWPPPTRTPSR
jgi:signal transduction histidine kinase